MTSAPKSEMPEFSELEGHELFKPVGALRPSQRLRLTAKVLPMVDGSDDLSDENIDALAGLAEFLEEHGYVIDLDGWTKFFNEKGLEGAITLATAYAGEAIGAKQ